MTERAALRTYLGDCSSTSRVVVLTGAGISAESGIPTFRGAEGYWTVGSRNYRSEELATWSAFSRMPDEIWSWYLHRRSVCLGAQPNAAHLALVDLEAALGERFQLVTQNVDGLHRLAGSGEARMFEVHGNVHRVRCAAECRPDAWPLSLGDEPWPCERRITPEERVALACPACGAPGRPHVLWFDESYDEVRYRFESSLEAAANADVFVVVGTTGTTGLPQAAARTAAHADALLLAIDPDSDPFGALFERRFHIAERATVALPDVVAALRVACA